MGLKKARINANLTVLQAAELLNVSDSAIYMWENGIIKPKTSRLSEIANLYGVTIDELLKEEKEND